ncbi:MAG TPA: hypothetical protein VHB98_01755, partial [Chloroflexota bacterium]|nr:hypothetical protein [Chloroflexota bacterium]
HSVLSGLPILDQRTDRLFVAEQDGSAAPNAPNWGRTEAGRLHVLDARTGVQRRTLPIEWPDELAVDLHTGWLLIGHAGVELSDGVFAGNGHVDVRDGRTGRLLRTMPVGVAPGSLAVDERTHRALVVNGGGQVPATDPWGWLPASVRRHVSLPPPPPVRTVPSSVSVITLQP